MYGYYEEDRCATEAEADQEYALWAGSQDTARAWVLSDRDVWYANPYYIGPRVPHPEDDIYTKEDLFWHNVSDIRFDCIVKEEMVQTGSGYIRNGKVIWNKDIEDDYVPF